MNKLNAKINVKSPRQIRVMIEGGKKLARIKENLRKAIKEKENAIKIDKLAAGLIARSGGKPSFKMVPGYSWTTCINVNSGVVHGIPKKEVVFQKKDLVSVDLGIFYEGFHTDTSFTIAIEPDLKIKKFLKTGELALQKAIKKARVGNRVFDISKAIQDTIESKGFTPIRALVGHGIGKKLHEDPQIPCVAKGSRKNSPKIIEGITFAIEVMYAFGKPEVEVGEDGWTISTCDGKIAALFEETVAVTSHGPLVLTATNT